MECRECGGGDDSNCCGVQSKFTIANGESEEERERGHTHICAYLARGGCGDKKMVDHIFPTTNRFLLGNLRNLYLINLD
jgi:hypothetical protein